MPTNLPTASPAPHRPVRHLTLRETVRFFVLLAWSRWLLRRLKAAHERVRRLGDDAAGDELLSAAYRWLDCHEKIGAMLGLPAPPQVAQVRAAIEKPRLSRSRAFIGQRRHADCRADCPSNDG